MVRNKETSNNSLMFILKLTFSIIIGLSAIIGFLFVFNDFLDNKIEEKITDTDYIYKLSKTLRPFCIFNRNGIVLYDHGAYNTYIDSIKIIKSEYKTKFDNYHKIYVYTGKYLQLSPLLQYIGPNDIIINKSERSTNKSWLFNFIVAGEFTEYNEYEEVFLIEILK